MEGGSLLSCGEEASEEELSEDCTSLIDMGQAGLLIPLEVIKQLQALLKH